MEKEDPEGDYPLLARFFLMLERRGITKEGSTFAYVIICQLLFGVLLYLGIVAAVIGVVLSRLLR